MGADGSDTLPGSTSVIVATRDRPQLLKDLLSSLAACAPRPSEVIVVDDASSSPAEPVAAEFGGCFRARCIRNTRRMVPPLRAIPRFTRAEGTICFSRTMTALSLTTGLHASLKRWHPLIGYSAEWVDECSLGITMSSVNIWNCIGSWRHGRTMRSILNEVRISLPPTVRFAVMHSCGLAVSMKPSIIPVVRMRPYRCGWRGSVTTSNEHRPQW